MIFLPVPEAGGGSEQTHWPAGGEDQAATKQTGEAESAPASTAEQGETEQTGDLSATAQSHKPDGLP